MGNLSTTAIVALAAGAVACSTVASHPPSTEASSIIERVDHLVYAAPNLEAAVDHIEQLLGVRATPGGQHPGVGTRNALVSLGPKCYLEIIAPDPAQATYQTPRPFGIDDLATGKLVAWAANAPNLEQLSQRDLGGGVRIGSTGSGSRQTPDGAILAWRFSNPRTVIGDGIVPFFIDWGESRHPARTAAQGATLLQLRAEHPQPEQIGDMLERLGLNLRVTPAAEPMLIATIMSPRGTVELR